MRLGFPQLIEKAGSAGALGLLCGALLLSGCAGDAVRPAAPESRHLEGGSELAGCAEYFSSLDAAVVAAGVADSETAPVRGFPYLRVNRFLATGVKPAPASDHFQTWVERLRRLDGEARAIELANLPAGTRQSFKESNAPELAAGRAERCGELLRDADLADQRRRAQLVQAAEVPADYSLVKRTLGFYPVTSLFFLAGVSGLHRETLEEFATPLARLDLRGRLVRYRPPVSRPGLTATEVKAILERAADNPLSIPDPTERDRDRLFAAFSPVWEVDVAVDDDRIGTPYWSADDEVAVDIARPAVFRRASHTRLDGETLLQLNYVVWFPSRPLSGRFDLLGGNLDGITWRVTLGRDGRPLLYDTMHNCGCYHMFIASDRLKLKAADHGHEEPPLVVQTLPAVLGPPVIRIAQGSHYVQRAYFDDTLDGDVTYALRDYRDLRSLPLANGDRRSLFRPDGLVEGSERGERWLFWPMGVAEPGAMRQWGHHAIAFVGRRHFDDPDLVERYFELVPGD